MYINQIDKFLQMKIDNVPSPCACTSVRRAARVLTRAYDASLKPSGMNITQLAVMRAVRRRPGEPMSHLAENLMMDRTSFYRELATLRRRKWVSLKDEGDGRSRNAIITEKGSAVLAKADSEWAIIQSAIVDRFGPAPWKAFVAELQRLIECSDAVMASTRQDAEFRGRERT